MRRLLWALPLVLGGACLGGCQKPLYPQNSPRSPYERYLTLRGDYRPPVETDAYGIERPALRQRLQPLR